MASVEASREELMTQRDDLLARIAALESLQQQQLQTEAAYCLNEFRLEALVRLGQMESASVQELIEFALEQAVALTQSTIGYLSFVGEDEKTLTMHSWSQGAAGQCAVAHWPKVFDVDNTGLWGEALRQRQPVFTNDYRAPSPLKKGLPEGHVVLRRHLNVPVFDGDRIVAIVGVGNKHDAYDDADARQLTLLTEGVWKTIERHRAEAHLRVHREQLEALIEQRTAELVAANEELDQTNRELLRQAEQRQVAEAELARQHQALVTSEAKLRAISDAALSAIVLVDSQGRIVHWNPAAERLFGYTADEVVGRHAHGMLTPQKHRAAAEAGWLRYRQTGEGPVFGKVQELSTLHRSGVEIPVEIAVSGVVVAEERCAVAVIRDISQRREAERALRESEERYRTYIDHSPVGVFVADLEGRYIDVNPAACRSLGYTREELLGLSIGDLLAPEEVAHGWAVFDQLMSTGQSGGEVLCMRRKNGEALYMSLDAVRLPGDRVMAFCVDLTQHKAAEEKLRQYAAMLEESNQALRLSNEKAEAATRAKSEFLANMSHEIRTPLTAIMGFSDLLMTDDEGASFDRRGALETIRRNGEHLLAVINDILDLSKIEAGKLQVEKIRCSLAAIVSDVASSMRVRAVSKRLSFRVSYDGALPETVETDPIRLRQILINLLGNAIKFTHEGEVSLSIRRADGDRPRLQFRVADTGIGMSTEQIRKLFQPFVQGDAGITRTYGGTGLGLAITRRLVEMLGGSISVESRPQGGSVFTVSIEAGDLDAVRQLSRVAEAVAHPVPTELTESNPLHCRILLAEDGLDNQRLISLILRKAGATVTTVEHGKAACERALDAVREGEPYDVILMDMEMPVMNGYQATRRLREVGYTGPILALTAHAMNEERGRCIEAGCDDRLTKPVDRKALVEAVRQRLPRSCDCGE